MHAKQRVLRAIIGGTVLQASSSLSISMVVDTKNGSSLVSALNR